MNRYALILLVGLMFCALGSLQAQDLTITNARIIVAQILPMTNDPKSEMEVRTYNTAIVDVVSSKSSAVCMVNMHDSFSASDLVDGVHPNQSGYEKMARIWEPAIRAMIDDARPSETGYHCGKVPRA